MNGSVAEIRLELAGVAEQLGEAYRHATTARALLADAVAMLTELDAQHPEPLVPPQLRRADGELDRSLSLISGGATAVADLDARL